MRRVLLWSCLVLALIHSGMKVVASFMYFPQIAPDMLQFMQYAFALPFLVILNIVVAAEPVRGSSIRFVAHAANLVYLLFCIVTVDQQATVPTVASLLIVLMVNGCAVALERSVRVAQWRNRRLNVEPDDWQPLPMVTSTDHSVREVFVDNNASVVVRSRNHE